MRRSILVLIFIIATLENTILPVGAGVSLGISIGEEGLRNFYLSVGDYYRVPEREVIIIRDKGISYEEMPVVLFIAGRAHVEPGIIADLRLRGMSWMDITFRFGLGPEIYYVPLRVSPGPPYGNAYGYYKRWPRKEWKKVRLGDADVVNLVNLKFTSEHYGRSPEEVVRMRSGGRNFIQINEEIKNKGKGANLKEGSRINEKWEKPNRGRGKFKD